MFVVKGLKPPTDTDVSEEVSSFRRMAEKTYHAALYSFTIVDASESKGGQHEPLVEPLKKMCLLHHGYGPTINGTKEVTSYLNSYTNYKRQYIGAAGQLEKREKKDVERLQAEWKKEKVTKKSK